MQIRLTSVVRHGRRYNLNIAASASASYGVVPALQLLYIHQLKLGRTASGLGWGLVEEASPASSNLRGQQLAASLDLLFALGLCICRSNYSKTF